MNKEVKLTGKMEMVIGVVHELGDKAFAQEVLDYLNVNFADRAELKTFNAVNATLAAVAGKGLANKVKGVYKEKLLTQYSLKDEVASKMVQPLVEDDDEDEDNTIEPINVPI